MRVWLLGSGSAGNALVFEADGARLMVDAGLGPDRCAERMRQLGADLFPRGVAGIVVTHHHGDHIARLEPLARALRAPLYLHAGISASPVRARYDVRAYARRGTFEVGPFVVRAEPVPHDAPHVALSVAAGEFRFGVATDLGHAPDSVRDLLADCDEALIEANHCPELLATGPYIPRLKTRVGGNLGHLSNEQAADLVARLSGSRTVRVWLGHLSRVNNTPERAFGSVRARARGIDLAVVESGAPLLLDVRRGRRAMTQLGLRFAG